MSQTTTGVHGQYGRGAKWKMHRNLLLSDSAACFQVMIGRISSHVRLQLADLQEPVQEQGRTWIRS